MALESGRMRRKCPLPSNAITWTRDGAVTTWAFDYWLLNKKQQKTTTNQKPNPSSKLKCSIFKKMQLKNMSFVFRED
jgi:hypothetical protein